MSIAKALLSVACCGLALSACTSVESDPELTDRPDTWVEGRSISAGEDAAAPTGFSLKLTAALIEAGDASENTFASPFSVLVALTMAMNGADGETREQMADLLDASGIDSKSWNETMQALRKELEGSADDRVELKIANSMWFRQGIQIGKLFQKRNQQYHAATIKSLDFNSSSAPDAINDWVADHTNDRIESIVEEIDAQTIAYLINAVYFNAKWSRTFKAEDTYDRDFTNADGSTRKVPLMHQDRRSLYAKGEDYQALRKPYGEGRFAMTIVLPSKERGMNAALALLDESAWSELQGAFDYMDGEFAMPKLESEWGQSLNQVLKTLGMMRAFDSGSAEFAGISPEAYIGSVMHKSFLKIDEKGTEAAAVTSVGVNASAAPMEPEESFTMICDRPYMIAITDTKTGAILFAGVINKP